MKMLMTAFPASIETEPVRKESPADAIASVIDPSNTWGGIDVLMVLLSRGISKPSYLSKKGPQKVITRKSSG